MKDRKTLTISTDLERQIREQIAIDLITGDPECEHTRKAKYLLDQLDKARKGMR